MDRIEKQINFVGISLLAKLKTEYKIKLDNIRIYRADIQADIIKNLKDKNIVGDVTIVEAIRLLKVLADNKDFNLSNIYDLFTHNIEEQIEEKEKLVKLSNEDKDKINNLINQIK